jgi:hypothetical protein
MHFTIYDQKFVSSCQVDKYKDIKLKGVEIKNKKCGNMLELYKYNQLKYTAVVDTPTILNNNADMLQPNWAIIKPHPYS